MSVMERTTYRRSLGSSALAFDEPRRDPQHAPYTSGPSTDSSSDDSIPLFLSDLQGQPDPREFAPFAASQRTSILTLVVAGGLVVSAFAILVARLEDDLGIDPFTIAEDAAFPSTVGEFGRVYENVPA